MRVRNRNWKEFETKFMLAKFDLGNMYHYYYIGYKCYCNSKRLKENGWVGKGKSPKNHIDRGFQ